MMIFLNIPCLKFNALCATFDNVRPALTSWIQNFCIKKLETLISQDLACVLYGMRSPEQEFMFKKAPSMHADHIPIPLPPLLTTNNRKDFLTNYAFIHAPMVN